MAASLRASWSAGARGALKRLLAAAEGRRAARGLVRITALGPEQAFAAALAVDGVTDAGPGALLSPKRTAHAAAEAMLSEGATQIAVSDVDVKPSAASPDYDRFVERLERGASA